MAIIVKAGRHSFYLRQCTITPETILKLFFLYVCSENAQTMSCPVTVVHGRRFHHAHAQTTVVKTAAQR